MNKITLAMLALLGLAVSAGPARAEISVVTTDTTLADIARHVGGNRVRVESLSRGTDDPHQVEPRPSMVVKVHNAQIVARIGMDLDIWLNGILDRAANPSVSQGGRGYVDCSRGLQVQEIPPAKLDPSMGDIHVYGNPHYLLDPANGILAARNIAAGLAAVDPGGRAYYQERLTAFANELTGKLNGWRAELAPFRGQAVTVFHRSWVYFMSRFGLKEFGTIEPKPGLGPSPGHVNNLVREMKTDHIRAVLAEDFRARRFPDLIVRETGAKIAYVPGAVEAEPGIDNYFKMFDAIVGRLAAALK